jgi:predicted flap endonuclease-1-like 5' DNA nuclease
MLQALSPLTRLAKTARDARQAAFQRAADVLGDSALRVVSLQARFGAASLAVARHLWFGDAPTAAPAPLVAAPAAAPAPVKAAPAKAPAKKTPAARPAPVVEAVATPIVETVAAAVEAPAPVELLASVEAATPDDLTALKGIGPKLSAVLNALGVTTYAQIAAWTPDDIVWFEDKLDFRGRVTREKWVEQAAAKIA